jgi:4-diphosphocytidyl-2-C-methyl-D-erythritol kinase
MNAISIGDKTVAIVSYAKINIGLKIVRQRADGYHDIETVFKIISLHDRVTLRKNDSGKITITCADPNVPTDHSNIAFQAVQLIEQETENQYGVDIDIVKNIPIGAGLGGGSSNGASVLVGMNELFQLGLKDEALMAMGAQLGSDVPFFVGFLLGFGNTAVGKGRGEVLDYFEWNLTEKVVLVYPKIPISTPWAYQNFKNYLSSEHEKKSSLSLTNTSKSVKFSALLIKPVFFDNNFEPLVFAEYPKIKGLREMLEKENAVFSRMSGSGSTVFGLFEKDRNCDALGSKFPDCFVTVAAFV